MAGRGVIIFFFAIAVGLYPDGDNSSRLCCAAVVFLRILGSMSAPQLLPRWEYQIPVVAFRRTG